MARTMRKNQSDDSGNVPFPGIDWDSVVSDASKVERLNAIENSYGWKSGMFAGDLPSSTPGHGLSHYPSPHRKIKPTKEVSEAIRMSSMPVSDIRLGGREVQSVDGRNLFAGMREAGVYFPVPDQIAYRRDLNAADRRGTLVHETAHALQALSQGTGRAIDMDKVHRMQMEEDFSSKKPSRSWRRLSSLYGVNPGLTQLESVPLFYADKPVAEGNAEGYRVKYSDADKQQVGYKPEHFGPEGSVARQLFETVKERTSKTGEIVNNADLYESVGLAGVLKSDLKDGKRQYDHDIATAHRMLLHQFSPSTSTDETTGETISVERPHHGEHILRKAAIEGEYVQGSLLPDMVPEVNQFGTAPLSSMDEYKNGIPLSPRGEALVAHRNWQINSALGIDTPRPEPVERTRQQTLDWMVRSPNQKMDARRAANRERQNYLQRRPEYYDRLRSHVREVEKRRNEESFVQQQEQAATTRASKGELHQSVVDWLGKLVYQKKRDYAEAYARHKAGMGDLPSLPSGLKEEHAAKARESIDKLWAKHRL